jgi:hypothetical protein
MNLLYEIRYNDLSYDKQEELKSRVISVLQERAKEEGTEFLEKEEYKGKTWQEAYCREYMIEWQSWEGNEEEAVNFNWSFAIDNYLENSAELALITAFKFISVEVEI